MKDEIIFLFIPYQGNAAFFNINGHDLPVTTNDESFDVFPNT
ncbi:Uncharacterized protein dnm_035780 [Desulfonema magnum]|uniref:Uncharacterized protein n=1 Tax=Desulfonema magnum TaxID=45655 RepID=A0A975BKT1_9BACT|nr:Uncharacterized protein dnm_035780 [Desulfonema magnum]